MTNGQSSSRIAACASLLMLLAAVAGAQPVSALLVTNLAGLQDAVQSRQRTRVEVDLSAQVCAADLAANTVVLKDESATLACELDLHGQTIFPGERIRIAATNCEAVRRPGTIAIIEAPLVDLGGVHPVKQQTASVRLEAGAQPLKIFYFNGRNPAELSVKFSGPETSEQFLPAASLFHTPSGQTNHLPGLEYFCYDNTPETLDAIRNAEPTLVGVTPDVDIGLRSPAEYVAMQFRGLLAVPRAGKYAFTVRSDDGCELYLGNFSPEIKVLGSNAPPKAVAARAVVANGEWAVIEGRVIFSGQQKDGQELEIQTEDQVVRVRLIGAGKNAPPSVNTRIRATGVLRSVNSPGGKTISATLTVIGPKNFQSLQPADAKSVAATNRVFTAAAQVQQLSAAEAARQYPVRIRGVITCRFEWLAAVIQDDTRGVFFLLPNSLSGGLMAGDFVEIEGFTAAGDFAAIILAQSVRVLGRGVMPVPAPPSWSQLISGNLDAQYAELRGIITQVTNTTVTLLTENGKVNVQLLDLNPSTLLPLENSLVRLRGCLLAEWDAATHQIRVGEVKLRNTVVEISEPPMAAPFSAPGKTTSDLLLFDLHASGFQRVKISGVVVAVRDGTYYLMQDGKGLRFRPNHAGKISPGDLVEVVGIPDVGGPSPLLHEAIVRKTGVAALPPPLAWPWPPDAENLGKTRDAVRVTAETRLIGLHNSGGQWVLELQTGLRAYRAVLDSSENLAEKFPLNSRLQVTGVYAISSGERNTKLAAFQLLLNSPADLRLLERPSWWTLRRLLFIVAALLAVLTASVVWITQLRRKVEQRTVLLEREHARRERAERDHAVEMERSRIARDLHDDLGASLTEIRVLASTGLRTAAPDEKSLPILNRISEKVRTLVSALDVIVWAVNPEANSLQSLADYLSTYAEDFLERAGITCRFKIPMEMPEMKVDGRVRHDLFLAVKETLNNIVRHAQATEVELHLRVENKMLAMDIVDNGCGFDLNAASEQGHGLQNIPQRLARLGGSGEINSAPGHGTTVRMRLLLPKLKPDETP